MFAIKNSTLITAEIGYVKPLYAICMADAQNTALNQMPAFLNTCVSA